MGGATAGAVRGEQAIMATRATCRTLQKVGEDEPIFVLRAKDILAPSVINFWCDLAQEAGVPEEKIDEAQRCEDAMRAWVNRHGAKVPD